MSKRIVRLAQQVAWIALAIIFLAGAILMGWVANGWILRTGNLDVSYLVLIVIPAGLCFACFLKAFPSGVVKGLKNSF